MSSTIVQGHCYALAQVFFPLHSTRGLNTWVEDGSRAREVEVVLEEQPHEDGVREGEQTAQDDPGEGVAPRRLDDGGRQAAHRQKAHPAKGSRMEVGGVPSADVRRRGDRRASLHREARLLQARGNRK